MHHWKSLLLTIMILGASAALMGYGFYMDDEVFWIPGVVLLVIPFLYWTWRYAQPRIVPFVFPMPDGD